jgi:PhzF family phenazine biosynthesis protein
MIGDVKRRFQQVDVFANAPYRGNPLAVVVDGDGLSDADMQRFANWTNLSETTFLLPPKDPAADYRVRIFTATTELPFAGHPTLGSCHAWLSSGNTPKRADEIVQECGVGLVTLRREDGRFAFAAPPLLKSGPVDVATTAEVLAQLQIDAGAVLDVQWVDNGPGWVGVLLESAAAVLALQPRPTGHLKIGAVGFHEPGAPCAYEVRGFFPENGTVFEDPVTGSLNASLAQWLIGSGRVTAPYVAAQGSALGRDGRVHVDQAGSGPTGDGADGAGAIWIGGDTVTCIEGTVDIPPS